MTLEFDSAYKRIEALEKKNEQLLVMIAKLTGDEGELIEIEATQNPQVPRTPDGVILRLRWQNGR